ncbi:MAG: acyltransferase [Verrucomicrobia bacterium]|nr:acyltransferase [Verrucomicrobiota bacterium]
MVVTIHAPPPGSPPSFALSSINYLSSPCIGIFFMVSGALLLPTRGSASEFLLTRFSRILPPLLTWTILYLVADVVDGRLSAGRALVSLTRLPLAPVSNGTFWFIYSLVGVYLVMPVVSPWLRGATAREIRLYLGLWALTTCLPFYEALVRVPLEPAGSIYGPFANFQGWVGYAVLGAVMRRPPPASVSIRSSFAWSLAIGAAGFIPLMFYLGVLDGLPHRALYDYLVANVVVMATAWFRLFQRLRARLADWAKPLRSLSDQTLGIFFCHFIVLRRVVAPAVVSLRLSGIVLQVALIAAASFAISWGVTTVLQRSPRPIRLWLLGR